jgi:hypothetical protein
MGIQITVISSLFIYTLKRKMAAPHYAHDEFAEQTYG